MKKHFLRPNFKGHVREHFERAPKRAHGRALKRAYKKYLKGIPVETKESEPCPVGACTFYCARIR